MDLPKMLLNWLQVIGVPEVTRARELDDSWRLADGRVVRIRAVRQEDGMLLQQLMAQLSLQTRYRRFFLPLHELTPDMLSSFTRADPAKALTLLAVVREGDREVAVAMAQCMATPTASAGEFAIVVADAWQRRGIATRLLRNLICVARAAGIERLEGEVLAENEPMQRLLFGMDFDIEPLPGDPYLVRAYRSLASSVVPSWACSELIALAKRTSNPERIASAQ